MNETGELASKFARTCPDYIFPVKASKPVKLRPDDAAHFLIGLRFADESEVGCGKLSRIEVRLQPGATPLEFSAVGSRVCGKIDVSGWRAGVYAYDELLRSASFK